MKKVNVTAVLCYVVVAALIAYIAIEYFFHETREAAMVAGKLEGNPRFPFDVWQVFFFIHIIAGAIALIVGPFQFLKASQKNRSRHRMIGKLYVWSIFISVPAGIYLSFYATGGTGSTIAFLILNAAWFFTTFQALKKIRERNVVSHQEWMLRSYLVTFVFVTFRILMPIFTFVLGWGFAVGFPLAVFGGMLINLCGGELYLRRKRERTANAKLVV